MHIESECVSMKECEKRFAAMNEGEIVAQMSVLIGSIATLKRLQEVGISAENVQDLLEGLYMSRVIVKSRGQGPRH